MELVVHATADEVAEATAQRIAEILDESEVERFSLGLAGGSTPAATYRALRGRATGWAKVDAWLSDERWVPPDDERSNGKMATETLMDHVEATFHRPRWSRLMTPNEVAPFYEATIRSVTSDGRPDLILLGMGDDAHTASLFPATGALVERQRWIVANESPSGELRLTATYPLLWAAKRVLFMVVGENKAKALQDSFSGLTPAGIVGEGDAEVEWHVDAAAASLVS